VPGNVGGINWGGLAYDSERKILVTATNRVPFEVRLLPRDDFDALRRAARGDSRLSGEFGTMAGTPFGMYRAPLLSPQGLPCAPPPWGVLTAVDFSHQRIAWEFPLGFIPKMSSLPGYETLGSFNLGGAMITGGLVFIGATMDPHLRAFDIETGHQLWIADLPTTAQATPMTYAVGGKQFIAVAAGGHGKLHTQLSDAVVAFALK
jgi:quinoprotein glucose dehydrogenase